MHPFRKYCLDKNIYMRDLAVELGINDVTLYRITQGTGSKKTRKIIEWCRANYIDPYEVFCVPEHESPVDDQPALPTQTAQLCTPTP